MPGFRLRVISLKKDLLDPKNTGEFLVLEAKKGKRTKPRLSYEALVVALGAFLVLVLIGIGSYFLLRR